MSKYAKYGTLKSLSKHNSRAVSTATHAVYLVSEEEMQRDLRNFDRMIDDAMNIFSVSNRSSQRATRSMIDHLCRSMPVYAHKLL